MPKLSPRYSAFAAGLAVIGAGLLAARPLFVPRLLHGTDSLIHFYTLLQLDELIRQGIGYSRWLPYRASGLGTPLFHYYAPLVYYLAESFKLFGLDALLALRVVGGLALVGGALGAFLWARDVLRQEMAALVAATAYVCGPAMLFNAFFRGGLAEQLALMLLPFVLWAFHRLAATGQMRYLAASALTYAAVTLSHNVTALIFSPVLLAYTLVLTRADLLPISRRRTPILLVVAMSLGLGLSAFFWLPALVERDAIMADLLYTLPGLDYHQNFMPLDALLIAPLTQTLRPGLSLVTLGVGVIGLFTLWPSKGEARDSAEASPLGPTRKLRGHTYLAAAVVIACIVMVLPGSVGIWEALPLLQFFQFPQRFLGVAGLFAAFLAGVGVLSLGQRFNRSWSMNLPVPFPPGLFSITLPLSSLIQIIVVGLLLNHTWGLAQVRYYPPLPAIDVSFIMLKEREQGFVNTIYSGNFVPVTVKTLPSIEQLAKASVERLDSTSLPAEATLIAASYHPLRYEVTLTSLKPFVLRFNTFYFPGWQAQLDGQATSLTPSDPYGFISVQIPAGQHHLLVWFGSTPWRTLANILSAGSAVMLGLVVLMKWFRHSKQGE
ncbi:MAG: glycosyltransferase family 39 protein [Anaerolineae bacterium]|nr:glycosyltransferase family 39 protein [Anaerolineae bacterium]